MRSAFLAALVVLGACTCTLGASTLSLVVAVDSGAYHGPNLPANCTVLTGKGTAPTAVAATTLVPYFFVSNTTATGKCSIGDAAKDGTYCELSWQAYQDEPKVYYSANGYCDTGTSACDENVCFLRIEIYDKVAKKQRVE